MTTKKKRHVIITTEYRGVYFGEIQKQDGRECILRNARMAIRWGTTRGVDQLASTGPTGSSKLGATAAKVWLCGITSVVDCTQEAIDAWNAAK